MPDFLDNTREGYDAVAVDYAVQYFDELRHKPLDQRLLDRLVTDVGTRGPICDIGCGPGQVAQYLRARGADVIGVDLSPNMVEEARRRQPDTRFIVGNMLALDFPDETLAGIAAFYSLIHIPRERVGEALGEWRRVLKPGGRVLAACHRGSGSLNVEEWNGRRVSVDFTLFQRAELEEAFVQAGFDLVEVVEREPIPDVEYQGPRVYVLAAKPA
jgi:ubiquinone/menaquinone biosynthesis C-methylase UbiE